jgi:hypothetical protein
MYVLCVVRKSRRDRSQRTRQSSSVLFVGLQRKGVATTADASSHCGGVEQDGAQDGAW